MLSKCLSIYTVSQIHPRCWRESGTSQVFAFMEFSRQQLETNQWRDDTVVIGVSFDLQKWKFIFLSYLPTLVRAVSCKNQDFLLFWENGRSQQPETQDCSTHSLFAEKVASFFRIGNFLQFLEYVSCCLSSCLSCGRFKKWKIFIYLCSGKQLEGEWRGFPWNCPTYLRALVLSVACLPSVGIWLSFLVPSGESSASREELEELGYCGGGAGQVGGLPGRAFSSCCSARFLVSDSWLQDTACG